MSKQRVITIDNGGSEIRVVHNSDDRALSRYEKNFAILDPANFRVKDNVDAMDVVDIIEAPSSDFKNMFVTGRGYYMYQGVDVSMGSQTAKTNSPAWYQQVILSIAFDAIEAVRKSEEISSEGVDFDYVLTTLIPVREHSGDADCAQKLKKNLAGTYTVRFPLMQGLNQVTFTLQYEHIGVLPEGVVAMTAMRNVVSPTDITLVTDMGQVSTDNTLCKGINMLGASVISSSFAGGTLLKLIGSTIRNMCGTTSNEMETEALKTGMVKIGNKMFDISADVKKCKELFVNNYVKDEFLNQFEIAGISPARVQYIVPIGAVYSCKDKDGHYDILDMIVRACNLENAEIKILEEDLRYVNVTKAADFCDAFARTVV